MKYQKRQAKNAADGENKIQFYFSAEPEGTSIAEDVQKVIVTAAEETLKYEDFAGEAEISVTLCAPAYIRSLNAEYRHMDSETDVLSFPIFDREEEDPVIGECIPLGDIVMNLDRAASQAKELGHSFLHEVGFLTVHSMLHLLGYDHEQPEEEEEMCDRQRKIMQRLSERCRKEGETL